MHKNILLANSRVVISQIERMESIAPISLNWTKIPRISDFCPWEWIYHSRNLFGSLQNKEGAYLLFVGPVASTSDCSFGKNPCSYLP